MNRKTLMTSAAAGILSLSLLAGVALPAMAQDTETSPAHPVEPGVPGGRGDNGPMGGRGMHDGAMGERGGMTGRDGMMGRGGMLGLSATVVSADDESIVVTLAVPDVAADDSAQADQPGGRPGNFGRGGRGGGPLGLVNEDGELELAITDESLVFDDELNAISAASLDEGDSIVIAPAFNWGSPAVAIAIQGDADAVSELVNVGQLVSEEGDTLVLNTFEDEEVTVTVSDATIWYNGGSVDRPDSLTEGLPLRVLGAVDEDGNITATLVASGHMR